VSFPLDPFFKGEEFRSVCFPLTRQLREHIENVVIEKYQNIMEA
jgi:stage V sporulation protein G